MRRRACNKELEVSSLLSTVDDMKSMASLLGSGALHCLDLPKGHPSMVSVFSQPLKGWGVSCKHE